NRESNWVSLLSLLPPVQFCILYPFSPLDPQLRRAERPIADIDRVVGAIGVVLPLEVKAVENVAARKIEHHRLAQVPLNSRRHALVVVEKAVVLVDPVGEEPALVPP